ncbi:MAG TPA: hypothetical protein VM347_20605 [Nonomuraea sp.]|nr:hypothetical protein [Nonomuraea sp.]
MNDVTALPETMLDVPERRTAVAPEAGLVRFEDGAALRVGECHERATAVARWLTGLVSPGDRTLTCLHPGPRLIEALLRTGQTRRRKVPLALDTRLAATEQLTTATGARMLITGTADAVRGNPDLLTLATRHRPRRARHRTA